MNLEPFQLGLLVAIAAVLLLLVLLGIGAVLALWGWARRHERGELRWTRYGAELRIDSPPTVRTAQQGDTP